MPALVAGIHVFHVPAGRIALSFGPAGCRAGSNFVLYISWSKIDGAQMIVALTRATDGLPRRAFTVHDIRRMVDAGVLGEDERFELVEGELVMMSAKGYAHG